MKDHFGRITDLEVMLVFDLKMKRKYASNYIHKFTGAEYDYYIEQWL